MNLIESTREVLLNAWKEAASPGKAKLQDDTVMGTSAVQGYDPVISFRRKPKPAAIKPKNTITKP